MRRKYDTSKSAGLTGLLFEPPGDWSPPRDFPDLTGVDKVGIDIESRDPYLNARGPGFIRGDAEVVGIALAAGEDSWYFPFKHLAGGNLDRDNVVRYFRDLLSSPGRSIVGANLQYELEGLHSLGIEVAGECHDVQVAEALLDEERDDGYDLGTLCQGYLGAGKDEALLNEAASAYGVDPKSGLWKLHSKYVGRYASFDALSALRIHHHQLDRIATDDLGAILRIETTLLPILWRMRLQGIPVCLESAVRLSHSLKAREDTSRDWLSAQVGRHIDEWSGDAIQSLCDQLKISYPRTAKDNASFTGEWLDAHDHPILKMIAEIRSLNRMRTTFIDKWIMGNHVRGRIHPQWKQLASDDGGTRTGRMACSNPNAQQVPADKFRDGTPNPIGVAIRACFRDGDRPWAKIDYSQQEARLLVHYAAKCQYGGAEAVAFAYRTNDQMDFYQHLADAAKITRRHAKDMTLGRMYGMGKRKMAEKTGTSEVECERILTNFDGNVPFVRELAENTALMAQRRGWIRTISGRKRHFNYWEPANAFQLRNERGIDCRQVYGVAAAQAKWPGERLVRADTRKALNALIQGSAADQVKQSLVQGYHTQGRIPYMAVHDELDGPVDDLADAERWKAICESAVELCVPVRAELSYGETWK